MSSRPVVQNEQLLGRLGAHSGRNIEQLAWSAGRPGAACERTLPALARRKTDLQLTELQHGRSWILLERRVG